MHRGMEEIYLSVPTILLDVLIKMISANRAHPCTPQDRMFCYRGRSKGTDRSW